MSSAEPWFGSWDLDQPGEVWRWQLGPLRLVVQRLAFEWKIGVASDPDPLDARLETAVPADETAFDGCTETVRVTSQAESLELRPRAADRPIVARPEGTLVVPEGAETIIYVGSPVWVEVHVGGRVVTEFPSSRPSDTWFGLDTMNGTIGYAMRTQARLDRQHLPVRAMRATTMARIVNESGRPLPIERIALPAPTMSLFWAEEGRLWTEAVVVEQQVEGSASTRVASGAPATAGECRRVAAPRQAPGAGGLVRAFTALLDVPGGKAWTGSRTSSSS